MKKYSDNLLFPYRRNFVFLKKIYCTNTKNDQTKENYIFLE